eukprot:TRINITY_DN11417_c0_g1_i1.p2 TRINITY_DN11417_c0_g1~~TRINITY_DN11417_c0_g1_i1.p2  ORF type:complete len:70 (-),score=10.11 TRINITY_DN11417_c0_g1_i1:191-400(-)
MFLFVAKRAIDRQTARNEEEGQQQGYKIFTFVSFIAFLQWIYRTDRGIVDFRKNSACNELDSKKYIIWH